MKYTCLLFAGVLAPVWGQQTVRPTAGALTPGNVAAAPATAGTPAAVSGSIGKTGPSWDALRKLEGDFDNRLKLADPYNPMEVMGYTRGLYLQGFGAVFSTEVDLAQNNIMPMFHRTITAADKATTNKRKVQHLELLRTQMRNMLTAAAKGLDLGPTDQVVVAVRLAYQGWEDRTDLPDQIVMRADRHGVQTGDIKVDVQ